MRLPSTPYKYVYVRVAGRTVQEHRLVMEQHLGRRLRRDEHVHHRNGNTWDNALGNLEILSQAEHNARHHLRHPRVKPCQACGREFAPNPNNRRSTKGCSKACSRQLKALRLRKYPHPKVKSCVACGQEFAPPEHHRGRTKTCSKACRYQLISKHPKVKLCRECGRAFRPPIRDRQRTQTCSKACRYRLMARTFRARALATLGPVAAALVMAMKEETA
jgi:hypothetical protein